MEVCIVFEKYSDEKIENANDAFSNKVYSGAIYHAYSAMVNSAKALLLAENKRTNTHAGIISQFDEVFVSTEKINLDTAFSELIYQIKHLAPSKAFAASYIADAKEFTEKAKAYRASETGLKKAV